jgi:hypothetical protein
MRSRLALAAAVAAALLAAGCGSDRGAGQRPAGAQAATASRAAGATGARAAQAPTGGGQAAGQDPLVAGALARTVAAGSARTAIVVSVTGSARATTLRGEGTTDFRRRRGELTLHLGDLGQGDILAVFDKDVVYEKLPAAGTDRPWIKLDLARLLGGGLDPINGNDPGQTLRLLHGLSGVREVGRDTVRGAATRHYRATLDLARVADQLAPGARTTYLRLLRAQGSSRRPAELWIDERGLLRRLRYTSSGNGAAGTAKVTSTITTEYYDFGVPVRVRIPPADQVRDVG